MRGDVLFNQGGPTASDGRDVYIRAGKYHEATSEFREITEFDRTPGVQAEVRYHLALCYRQLGYNDLARSHIEVVVRRHSDSHWDEVRRQVMRYTCGASRLLRIGSVEGR